MKATGRVDADWANPVPAGESLDDIRPHLRSVAQPVDRLVLDDRNSKQHGDKDIEAQCRSIKQFGVYRNLIVQKSTGRIAVGNGTYLAAQRLGLKYLPVELREMSDAEFRALAASDNVLGTLAPWDDEALKRLKVEYQELPEFAGLLADYDLTSLIDDVLSNLDLPDDEPDEPPPEPEKRESTGIELVHTLSVRCGNEQEQVALATRLEAEGYDVRVSTKNV